MTAPLQATAPQAPPWRVPDHASPAWRTETLQRMAEAAAHTTPVRRTVAAAAQELAQRRFAGSDPPLRQLARVLLWFVQGLPYVDDTSGEEWFQGVLYTLQHGGDCEDLSALLVALALAAGIPARVEWLDLQGSQGATMNHVAVRLGPHGEWAETIVPGAQLGVHPLDAARQAPQRFRPVAPAGAVPERWTLVGDTTNPDPRLQWAQYAQPVTAEKWFARAAALTTEARELALDARPWAEQRDATVEAWAALGAGFLALDLPPQASPAYTLAIVAAYGPHGIGEDGHLSFVPAFRGDRASRQNTPVNAWLAESVDSLYQSVQGDRPTRAIARRIQLNAAAQIVTDCLDVISEGNCAYQWCYKDGNAACDPYDWSCQCHKWGGQMHYILPKLKLSFQLARRIASQLAGKPARDILAEARGWTVLRNVQALREAGLARPEQLIQLREAEARDAAAHPRGRWFETEFLPTLYRITSALPPPISFAAAAGAWLADVLTRELAKIVPHLSWVGENDAFGRVEPRIQAVYISGDPSTRTLPTQDVPTPPENPSSVAPVSTTGTRPLPFLPGLLLPGLPPAQQSPLQSFTGPEPSKPADASKGASATAAGVAVGAVGLGLLAAAAASTSSRR